MTYVAGSVAFTFNSNMAFPTIRERRERVYIWGKEVTVDLLFTYGSYVVERKRRSSLTPQAHDSN